LSGHACIDEVCVATSAGCDAFCANACSALASCELDAGDSCADDCIVELGNTDCGRLEPLDRLSCGRLEHAYECASYCPVLCQRGAECATIDVDLCTLGCADEEPILCNVDSVAVRACEPIKVEARAYDLAGRALVEGADFAFGHDLSSIGLCEGDYDCDEPMICSTETNTCAMCKSDAECDSEVIPHVCTPEGCAQVDCLVDDDCLSGVCDPATHECFACREDADCTSEATPACDVERRECVYCTRDEHCATGIFGATFMERICDVPNQQCVQCLEDSHCGPDAPVCNLEFQLCLPS
jgi:hypothetical protein